MKVLITGGAGYIGTELTYALAEIPGVDTITVYDNMSRGNHNLFLGERKLPLDKIKFRHGDILDSRKLKQTVAEHDIVFHLAAKVSTPFADAHGHLYEQVNHWGTAEVVYAAEEAGIDQLVYLSSVSVYGSSDEEVSTGSVLNPKTFYGISKMRGEEHVDRYLQKNRGTIIRCGNVYGYSKGMRFDALINRFMFEANFNRRITINGDGNQTRAFIHISKVIDVLSSLITTPVSNKLCDLVEHNLSVNEVADVVKSIYPDLEMLFMNQHMQLRQLKVRPDDKINGRFKTVEKLESELEAFRNQFSF